MLRIATLDEAVKEIPGITRHELYTGVRSGKYPGFRAGGSKGKWLVDLDLLEARIKELMSQNISDSEPDAQHGKLRKIQG